MLKGFALLLPALVSGCYTYAPIQSMDAQPEIGVRARLSGSAADRVAPLLATTDARVLTGRLLENNNGTLIVEVPTVADGGSTSAVQTLYQRISLAPADIVQLESRRLDRPRTMLVAGVVVVAVGAAAIGALKGGPTADEPGSVTPTERRIPIFRLHF